MYLRIAHRGCPHLAPENSLQGFETALTYTPDFVEVDVRMTKDGMAVIMHDPKIDRTTDGKGKVAGKTFAELRCCRLKNGEPVPQLAEALDLLKGRCQVKVDVKTRMEEVVLAELRRAGVIRETIVIAYGRAALIAFKDAAPQLRTEVGGVYARHRRIRAISTAIGTGATIISAKHTVISRRFADDCRKRGLDIHAWTVNDQKTADRMRDLDVTAIATDRIDLF